MSKVWLRFLIADGPLLGVAAVWGLTFVTVKNAMVKIIAVWQIKAGTGLKNKGGDSAEQSHGSNLPGDKPYSEMMRRVLSYVNNMESK